MSEQTLPPAGAAPPEPAPPATQPPTAAEPATSGARTGITLAVILTCQLMLLVDGTVVFIALPDISRSLHFTPAGLSWVTNAYTLAFGGLLLLGGRTGDLFGRRRALLAGIALFTLASLLGGLATSAAWLLTARAAQGVGAALAGPSTLALIASNFSGAARARALAAFSAVAGVSLSLGLLVGGALTAQASWRWVLFVNVPIGVFVLVATPRFVRETPRQPARLDVAGALAATAGMAALVYGFIRSADDGWSDGVALGAFGVAAVAAATFLAVERRAPEPVVPLWLFADRTRAGAYANMLLLPATMFGMFFFLTQYVQEALGFGPLRAGLSFLPMAASLFVTSTSAARLVRRFPPRTLMISGCLLIIGGMVWLSRITTGSGYLTGVLGPATLFGIGVGLNFFPLNLTIMSGVPPRDAGAASGLLQAMQQVGASLGLAVLVTVFTAASDHAAAHPVARGAAESRRVLVVGVSHGFGVATAFAAAALLVAVLMIRPRTGSDRAPDPAPDR